MSDFKPNFEVRNEAVEALLHEIGHGLGAKMPKGYGFTLMIYGFGDNPDFFYISNAEREDMVRTMQEFIQKHREN